MALGVLLGPVGVGCPERRTALGRSPGVESGDLSSRE